MMDDRSFAHLAAEYREWMEDRWNHPCVVIWDAQNETHTPMTGAALARVRGRDLSNRPWDNGESAPMRPSDTIEAHPYKFTLLKKSDDKKKWATPCDPRDPYSAPFRGKVKIDCSKNPIIINEYGWVWGRFICGSNATAKASGKRASARLSNRWAGP